MQLGVGSCLFLLSHLLAVSGFLLGTTSRHVPRGGLRVQNKNSAMKAATATTSSELIELARKFVDEESGFYSPSSPDRLAEDFIFRGPVIGPLTKTDYLSTMETFKVYKAFPDISANTFGFTVDPKNDRRVWFFVRNTGINTGQFGLPFGASISPTGKEVEGPIEAFSVLFDEENRVKYLSVGYVCDRFEGNTGGQGAAFGLLRVMEVPLPRVTSWLYRAVVFFSNRILNSPAKSCSKASDLPEWWTHPERGPDGYV
uniref:DUF1990 domain-containing protein n=1 Tax=Chromera velia CCMP2878 TaxID=1169474 RepID=A0A0G4IDW9_9ALVE|mmetsp:Transcript_52950/g.103561  ORF Transcript_52950/g.103561 Transcript_52950/m.103561 type:complete len:257 (-) Transcript_52950:460-1230(-)|eukprot:Cvel_13439.t1-p1 / transcript=Cvel_13439.t1 / gene=Cvel_13439 / organism=Chromera_velia_CCMP2878 / gene_product=hypothetical protein / transcript_product=hypothetical protein / location=Cvel_scaffold917:46219-47213(+) / protein_length=256 / sequence_SO=supercontig / SO=protein_coding / is_pseudo=false